MGEERHRHRERERTEDNVSVGPSPPYCHPGLVPPRCCQACPKALWVGGASEGPLLSSGPHPRAWPLTPPSGVEPAHSFFPNAWVLLRGGPRPDHHPPILFNSRFPITSCIHFTLTPKHYALPSPGSLRPAAQAVHCTTPGGSICIDYSAGEASWSCSVAA